jgi:hypothetical protein
MAIRSSEIYATGRVSRVCVRFEVLTARAIKMDKGYLLGHDAVLPTF